MARLSVLRGLIAAIETLTEGSKSSSHARYNLHLYQEELQQVVAKSEFNAGLTGEYQASLRTSVVPISPVPVPIPISAPAPVPVKVPIPISGVGATPGVPPPTTPSRFLITTTKPTFQPPAVGLVQLPVSVTLVPQNRFPEVEERVAANLVQVSAASKIASVLDQIDLTRLVKQKRKKTNDYNVDEVKKFMRDLGQRFTNKEDAVKVITQMKSQGR